MHNNRKPKTMSSDDDTIESLYASVHPELVGMLYKKLGSREEADDLAQEAFERYTVAARTNLIDNPRAYIFRVANNLAVDFLRRHSVRKGLFVDHTSPAEIKDGGPSIEQRLIRQSEHKRLRQAIENMPPKCRQVFILRKLKGLSYAEIGEELGLSLAAVEKHVVRGLKICRLELIKMGAR